MKKVYVITFCLFLISSRSSGQVALHLFGGTGHDVYLGCINCSNTDPSSIYNTSGKFGSKLYSTCIWNPFSQFSGKFSQYSPFNQYAKYPPVIVDYKGNFYGYLTVNKYFPKRSTLALAENILEMGTEDPYTIDNTATNDYYPQSETSISLYTPNWDAMYSMMAEASRRVEELHRQGYVFDPVSNNFVPGEVYNSRVSTVNDQKAFLRAQFANSGVRTKELSDGEYNVGLHSNYASDPVYYGVATIKKGYIKHILIMISGRSVKMYPQSKAVPSYGYYEGMLVNSSLLKSMASYGTNSKIYFLTKMN